MILIEDFVPESGQSFELLRAAGGITGQFSGWELPGLAGGLEWDLTINGSGITLAVMPEPGTAIFLLLGAVAGICRRKH